MNPLQFQVTTTATRTHICSEAGKQKWTELTWDMSNANYRDGARRHDIQETGLPTQVKYMKRQTRWNAEPVALKGIKSNGISENLPFFSEVCLKKKKKKGKGKCKYHGGELDGKFRFIENFIFKINPLQFQVTTTGPPPHPTHTHRLRGL